VAGARFETASFLVFTLPASTFFTALLVFG
jgi:hypothetical protein